MQIVSFCTICLSEVQAAFIPFFGHSFQTPVPESHISVLMNPN